MTTDRHFGMLYEAALHDPADVLALRALADWHEDASMPHQAALLRLAAALREVPYPDEPDKQCKQLWVNKHLYPDGGQLQAQALASISCWYPDIRKMVFEPSADWPRCQGWHGAGRLPGFAAAHRMVAHPKCDLHRLHNLAALHRHILRCELYACGVIDARQRDEEHPTLEQLWDDLCDSISGGQKWMPISWPGWQDMADLWRLRGGAAGRAVNVMVRFEATQKRFSPVVTRNVVQALARTYSRDLLRCFAAGEPWVHSRGVYAMRKVRKPA